MKNTTTIAIAMALAVTAVPSMIWYYQLPDEPAPSPEPETSEPVMTEEQKQGLFDSVAIGVHDDINQVVSYGLISEAQADELKAATDAIVNEIKPEDLVQALMEAKDSISFYAGISPSYVHLGPSSVVSNVNSAFTEYLSPQLNSFYSMVGGDKGCIGKFDQSETLGVKYDIIRLKHGINSVSAHLPDGVKYMECENGADVNLIGYPANAADVRISYDFEHSVAYFKEAEQHCDDVNGCFSTKSFTELEDEEGLARAFDDKAAAEASLSEVKAQAQAYIAENWSQIEADLASVTKPAAPVPR